MAGIIDQSKVQRDIDDIGKTVNEDTVVNPRSGLEYDSLPKVVREAKVNMETATETIVASTEVKSTEFMNDLATRYLALSLKGDWQAATAYVVKDLVFVENITYICLVGHTSSSSFQNDLSSGKWFVYQGATQVDLQNYVPLDVDYPPILDERSVKFLLDHITACFRYGLNDHQPRDDNNDHFRGLENKDAWAPENIGQGSVALGRNGCSKAYLSFTIGHDCITYGTASTAAGAGSATGNPDAPNLDRDYGYCSISHGKDTLAMGARSAAFGTENVAGTINSFAHGYQSETGKGLSSHPEGIVSDGDCAFAFGYRAKAYGDFSVAFGSFITAYNSALVFGRGINPGSPLVSNDALVLGYGVDVPTLALKKGDGTNGGFGKLGVNTSAPKERVDILIKHLDKVAIRTEQAGNGAFDLQSTLSNGNSASIFRIQYTSPNIGSANGVTTLYQNSNKFMTINESGDPTFNRVVNADYGYYVGGLKVVGGRMPAIADLAPTATLADVISKFNSLLSSLREDSGHGLIAK